MHLGRVPVKATNVATHSCRMKMKSVFYWVCWEEVFMLTTPLVTMLDLPQELQHSQSLVNSHIYELPYSNEIKIFD